MKSSYILILAFLLVSCSFLNDPEHDDFEMHSDCRVYQSEVSTERYSFGRVEFIDTNNASGCAKQQLSNTYLLYKDTFCVVIYNEHPKKDIKVIEDLINKFRSDTTRLATFAKFDDGIRITVSRVCKDISDSYNWGRYVEWKDIEYATFNGAYSKKKDSLITTWYNWKD